MKIKSEHSLQSGHYQPEEFIATHVHLCCLESDEAHLDGEIVGNAACHHVHSLAQARGAV
eukprot:CAMPEP_0183379234 /NCGR_PEP_ID=MMETSP0164_2-20130417/125326_1 /TAXON_ID=221442 /ORGANISM="Coccolithus pelagicus ssp braarudi, Strain PLY182g" /LENGTH=59 /DNA_ID=CAMNT_0025556815 /DNA_START=176 /DNA_END=355 /DNA_ORIENTATION=-